MKILLLEDDLPLGTALHRALTADGHAVMWLRTASDAEAFLMAERFDLALLDIVLPDGSGLDVLARLRARGDATPVMMLTARDTVSDRVNGLDAGADDYLPKPFAIEELLSRMRALLRHSASSGHPWPYQQGRIQGRTFHRCAGSPGVREFKAAGHPGAARHILP